MTGKQNAPEIRFEGFTDPWEQRKLSSIAASFDYGLNAAATEYDGQNKYLRITDIDDATHEFLKSDLTTPLADLAMSADYLLEEGDLLFARTGASVGKTYLYRQYDGTVYFAGFLIRARIGESADPEFVYQATLTDAYKKYVAITSQRSGQPGVNAQEYADYQLMLPSRTEQQQIGMTLRSLDNLITLHQRKYDKLCTVKKSMLDKMFPKPGETEPEIRFEGFTDPWEQRKLGELMDVTSVRRVRQEDWTDEGVRFLRARDLVAFAKNEAIEDPLFISDEMYREYSAQSGKVVVGDLLVTGVGTIGVPWLVTSENPVYFKDGNIIWFKNQNAVDGEFFYHSFTAHAIQSYIKEAAGIGTVGTYTIETGKKTPIWLPLEREQHQIAAFMTSIDTLITLHQRKCERLRRLKAAMLDKMFV